MIHGSTYSQKDINAFTGADYADFDAVRAALYANPILLNSSNSWNETTVQAAAQTDQVLITGFLLAAGNKHLTSRLNKSIGSGKV